MAIFFEKVFELPGDDAPGEIWRARFICVGGFEVLGLRLVDAFSLADTAFCARFVGAGEAGRDLERALEKVFRMIGHGGQCGSGSEDVVMSEMCRGKRI